MTISFKPARKAQSFLRMAVAGPSGAGKTYTSLELAVGLAAGRPIAVIDTERGSASKYADLFSFDVLELDSYHPERYIEAIEAAAAAGYAVLIIDSLSHAWNGTGGALELHDQAVKRQKTQNSYTAWADVTPFQNRLVNAITGAPLHIIATMRSKTEYVQDKNERGGTTIRKVGMAPIQRDQIEYEFDIFGQMDVDHNLIIEKSRCSALASAVIARPGAPLAATLTQWLQGDDAGDTTTATAATTAVPAGAAASTVTPAQPTPLRPQQPQQPQQRAAAQAKRDATAQPAQAAQSATSWVTTDGYDPTADGDLKVRIYKLGVNNRADFEALLADVREHYHTYDKAAILAEVLVREGRRDAAKTALAKANGVQHGVNGSHDLREAFPADQQRGA